MEGSERAHILVADDEVHTRRTLSLLLEEAGYKVSVASDGGAALNQIHRCRAEGGKIDLLLLDVQMPVMTGTELLDALNGLEEPLPVLVITGHGDRKTLVELIRAGCTDYLDKPFGPEELMEGVTRALSKGSRWRVQREEAHVMAEEDRIRLQREVEAYRKGYETLVEQMNGAVDSFENLVRIEDNDVLPLAYRCRPLARLGGDYLGFAAKGREAILLLADVAGHDMGASYHSLMIKFLFDEMTRNPSTFDAPAFLRTLNELLLQSGRNERMVTALLARFDLDAMRVRVASAGQPFMVHLQASNPAPVLFEDSEGDVLGMFGDVRVEENMFPIRPGDRFVFFTDGCLNVARVQGEAGTQASMTRERLAALAAERRNDDLRRMVDSMWEAILEFCRQKPRDDMLLAGVEVPADRR